MEDHLVVDHEVLLDGGPGEHVRDGVHSVDDLYRDGLYFPLVVLYSAQYTKNKHFEFWKIFLKNAKMDAKR